MSVVLRDVELQLAEFVLDVTVDITARTTALYGPSGAGKTSLLEVIAGLRTPRAGAIELGGRVVFDGTHSVPPRERRIGYVPQDDALFPHLSARQNALYGARQQTRDGQLSIDHVAAVLEIDNVLDRRIAGLSGGERKRIALARALLSDPEVLLLDEPLSGIDAELRTRVLDYLVRVRDEFPIPMIYVTHFEDEAAALCEEMIVLERGRIVTRRRL